MCDFKAKVNNHNQKEEMYCHFLNSNIQKLFVALSFERKGKRRHHSILMCFNAECMFYSEVVLTGKLKTIHNHKSKVCAAL